MNGKRRCCYDIESYQALTTFTFKDFETKEYFDFCIYNWPDDPSKNINQLPQLVSFLNKQIQWLIGYNSHDYDDLLTNYILINSKRLCSSDSRIINTEINNLSSNIISFQKQDKSFPEKYLLSKKDFYNSIDLILLFNTIDRVGLKQLAINLRHPRVQDLPYPPDHIVLPGQINEILDYNRNDVDITELVFINRSEAINDRIRIGKKLGVDVVNKCDTDIAKVVLAKYYEEGSGIPYSSFSKARTHYERVNLGELISPKVKFQTRPYAKIIDKLHKTNVDPNKREEKSKKKKQFEHVFSSRYLTHTMGLGGLHSNNPAEILTENEEYYYIDLDVASYYPWLIILERFFPRHLGEIFIEIYRKKIAEERMTAKKAGDAVLALMLKFAANGTFGLTKSVFSWLYDPKVTYGTCINGELFLLMLIEALELHSDCMVVYSNTDGLTVRVPKYHYCLFHELCTKWQVMTGLELEFNRYKRMVVQDVNNYLIFTYDTGKKRIKAKGAYVIEKEVTKGYENPIIAKAVQAFFDKGTPVADTIFACSDIYDFMRAERTSIKKFKVVLFERNKPINSDHIILQKNNRWVVTNNNPKEGKLVKIDLETGEQTEMQKGHMVTVLNDVPTDIDIKHFNIDYDFYIYEAMSMINLKPSQKETHVVKEYQQGTLVFG
jgi:hypothetical protein